MRRLGYLAAALIAAYFLLMAWPGLHSGFSHDDLMNMSFTLRDGWAKILRGNVLFFSTEYRPFGALFYRTLYDLFGWNSFPFRLVCIAAVGLNLFLCYRVARQVTSSPDAGLMAALFLAWHGNLAPLFFGSGNCYDVFAFTFYFAALTYYVHAREHGSFFTWRQLAVLAVLQICALNSKEFTATLPVLLLVWELIFRSPDVRAWARWPLREGRGVLLSVALSGIYTLGKVFGPGSLTAQQEYRPRLSLRAYADSTASVLNDLFYKTNLGNDVTVAWYVILLLGLALLVRSRAMLFGAAIALLSTLPVMLIPPRGLASHYVAMAGLFLWTAAFVVEMRRRFTEMISAKTWEENYTRVAVFCAVALFAVKTNAGELQFQLDSYNKDSDPIQWTAGSLLRHPEWLKNPKRPILIVSDPFENQQWATIFTGILVSGNYNIQIDRLRDMNPKPDLAALQKYKVLLVWKGRDFEPVAPESVIAAK